MSLINDALKQAQKNQSQSMPPASIPPLRPSRPSLAAASAPKKSWLVAVLVVALIIAAVVIIGLASLRRPASQIVAVPAPLDTTPSAAATAQPTAPTVATMTPTPPPAPVPVVTSAAPAPAPPAPPAVVAEPVPEPAPEPVAVAETSPEDLPKLQGIFYSPTSPSAIIDGKTVRAGDRLHQYRVKQIYKVTVLLTGPNGKTVQLTMH